LKQKQIKNKAIKNLENGNCNKKARGLCKKEPKLKQKSAKKI